jgi:hypothetical protein
VFRYVLGSEGCVLVPRSSGTPVSTWAWPIWVVSRRCVLEVVFILLEYPSPSRRILSAPIHSPLSGLPYRSFKWYQSRFGSLLTLTSLRSKDGVPGTGFGSSTLRSKNYQMWSKRMGAFLRGKGQILWDVTVDTGYVRPMDFLAPGSRDRFDANNKAVDYLFRALCQPEFDRVHTEHLACRIWEVLKEGSCWECPGLGTDVCDLPERVRELHSSPR